MLDQDRPVDPKSPTTNEPDESFGDILSQYEQSHTHRIREEGKRGLEGTVVAVTGESVFLDIGYKTEGIIPLAEFQATGDTVKVGDKMPVSIKGRDPEGYYELSRIKVERPKDWSSLEKAFADKAAIAGMVTAVVKGGVSVDVGVRAFMPASRSGARDAAEMEKLVGQEIRCRIIKLDVADEDVVVDRRAVLEEEERANKDKRYSEVKEGETVQGTVRSLTDYGAFVDIGGVDALLHVADISWGRVNKPADVLKVGDKVEARILKVDPAKKRISLGLKQLQPHPWDLVAEKYKVGERVNGTVTRVTDFGAFVELEKGIEGLMHLSEMSWSKKVRKPSDVVKPGDPVEVVVLGVNAPDRRISLGLKQALGDPWADAAQKSPGGLGGGRSGHQHPEVRRVRAGGRRRRGHGPRRRYQRGEAHQSSAGRAACRPGGEGAGAGTRCREAPPASRHEAADSHQPRRVHRRAQGRRRGHRPHDRCFRRAPRWNSAKASTPLAG